MGRRGGGDWGGTVVNPVEFEEDIDVVSSLIRPDLLRDFDKEDLDVELGALL